ncbi:ribonucleoside triphosphate reductase [Stylonychia lemnae]|uniref:ribonucleoside-triphosphate reductase (thioredoxin) n=1 Tax=Stylonychia lemnae TaxID=5949 RepID=A0A078ABB6_STYLE|nr:ribonucleoside triphosphate reductase [Stylonychia lemnae]|eukprot:CDW79181.1 ribonucleoside triphosphate reductase [Stylonychia lemnae]
MKHLRLIKQVQNYRSIAQASTRNFSQLNDSAENFRLSELFVKQYDPKVTGKGPVQFGFNGVGELAYRRSYSRVREVDGQQEDWHQTVERVVNGVFTVMVRHSNENNIKVDSHEQQKLARKMYEKIYNFKFLPPGRGLWAMGTNITEKKGLYAALNNCAFVSTKSDDVDGFIKSFTFLMDSSMMGVGVGFDTKGALLHKHRFYLPKDETIRIVIDDTREGWVRSLEQQLNSYLRPGQKKVVFDYSQIRPPGIPLKTFGGTSSGPEPLVQMHKYIDELAARFQNQVISTRQIVDIMNIIGKCVVAGNIRRVAEIALGEAEDSEFINLKNYKLNPDRMEYGWVSNNSIYAKLGMNYKEVAESIYKNGEPGLCWLENMQQYSRMGDPKDNRDHLAAGGNPCLEQTLESYEMCCLVETFPHNHNSYEEFEETLKLAFMYAKAVTLGLPHWDETAKVMARNRRIGCSMSGIAQFIGTRGVHELVNWCDQGYSYLKKYDSYLSKELFKIPESIKITSIKPSGTVSLLAGATPGVHFPLSANYIRRVRLGKSSHLIQPLLQAGYHIEDDQMDKQHTSVVEIPVSLGDNIRTLKEATMWEQLQVASLLQKHWADNQVSCTVTFDPEKGEDASQIEKALDYFQYQLKGISFLPKTKDVYPQMPYEEITKEEYHSKMQNIHQLRLDRSKDENFLKFIQTEQVISDPQPENYCDADKCKI